MWMMNFQEALDGYERQGEFMASRHKRMEEAMISGVHDPFFQMVGRKKVEWERRSGGLFL